MSLIMLVDDDADILRLTERWVVKAGYETITATSGKDALDTPVFLEHYKTLCDQLRDGIPADLEI